jgi:hypothetical protein
VSPFGRLDLANRHEQWARIAYKVIALNYRRNPRLFRDPEHGLVELAAYYGDEGLKDLEFWILAYWRGVCERTPLAVLRRNMVARARQGYDWRQVAFPPYKKGRRP